MVSTAYLVILSLSPNVFYLLSAVCFDLLLDFFFHIHGRQIERDCEFLEAERIMDYSLLIGVHFRTKNSDDGDTLAHSSGTTTKRYYYYIAN